VKNQQPITGVILPKTQVKFQKPPKKKGRKATKHMTGPTILINHAWFGGNPYPSHTELQQLTEGTVIE